MTIEKPWSSSPHLNPLAGGPGHEVAEMFPQSPEAAAELATNLATVFERSQAVWAKLLEAAPGPDKQLRVDPFNAGPAFAELWLSMMSDPNKLAEQTVKYWSDQAELWRRAALRAAGEQVEPLASPERGDKRFTDPDWSENVVFDALKQSYLLSAAYLTETAHSAGDLEAGDRKKVEFFTRQFVEAMSPSNFFATNPQVLRATIEERGANLVRGMEHVLTDLERGHGTLLIKQTDLEKFKVGENVAVTSGQVIYRNDIMELIQYAPNTETVQARPLLICPPWINKYYILDLNPKKSMVQWLVDQGHTVFMISWVNPGPEQADKEFVDYIAEGLFEAAARVLEETGAEDLNVAAYCIGGTMTGAALAYLADNPAHPLSGKIASATFFTSQFEFSDAGELQIFVDDPQLEALGEEMIGGTLGAEKMAAAFNMLRASDLIWSFVVSNYLLGKEPFPFDLLYWNSDSTRMPGKVHKYYLETFYRDDALALGEMRLGHSRLDLGKIGIPTYHIATKEDHIAPAASVYRGVKLTGGDRRFIIAGSGHIAGVVNPPAGGKYQFWSRDDGGFPDSVEDWRAGAAETPGSWWGDWDAWLKALNENRTVEARRPGRRHNSLGAAPGEYVRLRFDAPVPAPADYGPMPE